MRSYGAPRERKGSLGDLAIDGVVENKTAAKVKLVERAKALRAYFNEVKNVRRMVVGAITERKDTRVNSLIAVSTKVPTEKGFGRHVKIAVTELKSMASEASTKPNKAIDSEKKLTALLRAIKSEYKGVKARIEDLDEADLEAGIVDVLSDEAKLVLQQFNKEATNLKFPSNKDVTLARAPIIPLTKGFFDIATARRSGLDVENIGGYMLLRKQIVIGLRGVPAKSKAMDIVEEFLDSLRAVTRRKLFLVTEKASRKDGNLWYWVADNSTLSAMRKASRGSMLVTDWGFGFTTE